MIGNGPGPGREETAMAASKSTVVLPDGASVVLRIDGAELTLPIDARTFKSGSLGYYGQTKVSGADGRRYQVGITATCIGTKPKA